MKTRLLLCMVAATGLGLGCDKDNKKAAKAATPAAGEKPGEQDVAAGPPAETPAESGVAKIFAGSKPVKTSAIVSGIELGMKHEAAEALWNADKAKFKTSDFRLGFVASDDKSVDMIQYTGLPETGVVELGNAAWGEARLDPAANDPEFPVKRSCWFNTEDGVRACARFDERMSWTTLTIDHYLAAESMVQSGLFVFERGQSLLGKDYEGLQTQLLRFDDWPNRKNSFIPPTDFGDINKLNFEFSEDGKVTSMEFRLDFVDEAHRDRLLAGLAKGLGEATAGDGTWSYSAQGRSVVAKEAKSRLKVTVK